MSSSAYQDFLGSADPATWRECLDRAMVNLRGCDGAAEEQAAALAEALSIAAYLSWISRASGDSELEAEAAEMYRTLAAQVDHLTAVHPADAFDLCRGIALGYAGYASAATPLLARSGRVAPEHLLLVLPSSKVRAAAMLRPVARGTIGRSFLPVAHFFGHALASLGAAHEARGYIDTLTGDANNPLLLDVIGVVDERLGQWTDADRVYRASSWPVHQYRGALVAAIAGRASAWDTIEPDERTLRRAGELETDFGHVEIGRSMAFLNACAWRPAHSWVVELELGKLSFG